MCFHTGLTLQPAHRVANQKYTSPAVHTSSSILYAVDTAMRSKNASNTSKLCTADALTLGVQAALLKCSAHNMLLQCLHGTSVASTAYAVRCPGKLIEEFEHNKQVALKPARIICCITVTVCSLAHGLVQQLALLLELCSQANPAPCQWYLGRLYAYCSDCCR